MAKDIPAGSSVGALLEELRASEDASRGPLDYHALSQQHAARQVRGGWRGRGGPAQATRVRPALPCQPSIRPAPGTSPASPNETRERPPHPTPTPPPLQPSPASRRPLLARVAVTAGQYLAGLVVGALQALVVLFYQWVVDPAEYGTW